VKGTGRGRSVIAAGSRGWHWFGTGWLGLSRQGLCVAGEGVVLWGRA